MKILHILEDYSIHSGGIRTVVKELDHKLNQAGLQSFIISSKEEVGDNIYIVNSKNPWLYSKDWNTSLNEIHKLKGIDVIHIHGVWLYPQYIGAKFALKNKIPFVLTPHGMYEPWIWTKGTLKKKLYYNFLTKKIFSKSHTIHGITTDEIFNLKKLFKNPKFVEIPNLINNIDSLRNRENLKPLPTSKYILYLGRLDSKKGIDLLIKSFSKLEINPYKLKIAGAFNSYKISLEKLVEELGISDKVEFLGLVKGKDKVKLYKEAFVFVAPSHSEVVGMVNLEAAINKVPVITTYQTGLKKEWNNQGGMLINPTEKEIYSSLREVLTWSTETRNAKGEKLFNFVVENYSWNKKIIDWKNMYSNTSN